MRNIKLFAFAVLASTCHLTSIAQKSSDPIWKIEETNNSGITINGKSAENVYKKNDIAFSLNDIIVWPQKAEKQPYPYLRIYPLATIRIEEKEYKRAIPVKISTENLKENKQTLLWFIKHNKTSGKSGKAELGTYFDKYEDYMINDTITIIPEIFPIRANRKKTFFFTFVKDGNIKYVKANKIGKSKTFFFTRQQLEEAGYDFKKRLSLQYGKEINSDVVVVKDFIIND